MLDQTCVDVLKFKYHRSTSDANTIFLLPRRAPNGGDPSIEWLSRSHASEFMRCREWLLHGTYQPGRTVLVCTIDYADGLRYRELRS